MTRRPGETGARPNWSTEDADPLHSRLAAADRGRSRACFKNGGRETGGRRPFPRPPRTREDARGFPSGWARLFAAGRETRPKEADQASSASSLSDRSSSRMRSAISPEFSRMASSILSAISGFVFRNALEFSRPWPNRTLS
jgi:hypothetical protein